MSNSASNCEDKLSGETTLKVASYHGEILSILADIKEMEEAISHLKKNVLPARITNASDNLCSDGRLILSRYLYWFTDNMSVLIAKYLLNCSSNQVHQIVGPITQTSYCTNCWREFDCKLKSRTSERTDLATCETCLNESRAKREIVSKEYLRKHEDRLLALKTMPYSEYLKIDHWKERRKRHLKSAGYRCQLCNSGDCILDVHHRTYKRRGQERYNDLIVLCRVCHEIFHRERELIKE
jgi:hypothetical protein